MSELDRILAEGFARIDRAIENRLAFEAWQIHYWIDLGRDPVLSVNGHHMDLDQLAGWWMFRAAKAIRAEAGGVS